MFYGVLASLCVALNAIYIKKFLPLLDDDMWRLTAYNNINGALLFVPAIVMFGETSLLAAAPEVVQPSYWGMMLCAGLFGWSMDTHTHTQRTLTHNAHSHTKRIVVVRFGVSAPLTAGIAIGIVTMWQIQVTSPLTHNISGTAKVPRRRPHPSHAGVRADHLGAAAERRQQVGHVVVQQRAGAGRVHGLHPLPPPRDAAGPRARRAAQGLARSCPARQHYGTVRCGCVAVWPCPAWCCGASTAAVDSLYTIHFF